MRSGLRLYRRRHGAAFLGYGTCRLAQCAGHAEGCRLPGARSQYGGIYEGTHTHPGVYGRLPWLVHQPAQPLDELPADWSRTAGRHDGQSDGGFGVQSGIHQQIQGKTQPALHEAGRIAHQVVQRSGIRLAARRLSPVGDSVQPVRQEPLYDERHCYGEGQGTLGYDCR